MTRLPFHPALEGLRGLAVVAVLLFHGDVPGVGGGFLGVSTFFTLSGFLITGLLVAEREQTHAIRLRAFWGRRFRRLMPAGLVGLVGIALLALAFGDWPQQTRLRADGLAALLNVANWWLILTGADYAALMGSPSFVQHFWSLAIEEQFYAFFPGIAALLLALRRRLPLGLVLSGGTLASFAWMTHLSGTDVTTARLYFGTDTRCGELLLGGVLALLLSGRPISGSLGRTLAGLGCLGLGTSALFWTTATVESPWLYQFGLPLYSVASAAVVGACVAPFGPVRSLLSLRPLRFIGRVSYGAYVYHWPIFLVLDERTGLGVLPLLGARIALTFAVATLSRRWIEQPILEGRFLAGWRGLAAGPLAFASVGLLLHYARPDVTLPELPEEPAPLVAQAPRIAVLGDSVGDDIASGLEMWAHRTGEAEIKNLAIPGCGLAIGAWPGGIRRHVSCGRWRGRVHARLSDFGPDLIVVTTTVWELSDREKPDWGGPKALGDGMFDAWIIQEFEATARFFEEFDAPLVWLTCPCIRKMRGGTDGAFDPARVKHMNDTIIPAVAESTPRIAEVIDLYDVVCPAGQFTNNIYGIRPFRRDGIHFSERGMQWVGEWLGPQLVDVWDDIGPR